MTLFGQILSLPVRVYSCLISPMLPPTCRYVPTCSQYALDALRMHGGLAGGWLALRRIGRCHPWGGSGFDPVPECGHCDTSSADGSTRSTEIMSIAPIPAPTEADSK